MKSVTVTIGGAEHTIRELPSRKAAAWRQGLQERLGDIAKLFESAPETDISSVTAISGLVQQLGTLVVRSPDTVIELLLAYAPQLEEALSGEECYDSELIAAFIEVLRLAYPFGGLLNLVASLGSGGAAAKAISTS